MSSINDKMDGSLSKLFDSFGNERETPWGFYWRLDDEFHFTLDPCASHRNHKCERYFTKTIDGLKQDWSTDVVFVNPPYGHALKDWAKKCFGASRKGATVVMLIPARTNTQWFHNFCMTSHEIRLIRGRLKFINADGIIYKHGIPFPLCLVIFHPIPLPKNPKLSTYEAYHSLLQKAKGADNTE